MFDHTQSSDVPSTLNVCFVFFVYCILVFVFFSVPMGVLVPYGGFDCVLVLYSVFKGVLVVLPVPSVAELSWHGVHVPLFDHTQSSDVPST